MLDNRELALTSTHKARRNKKSQTGSSLLETALVLLTLLLLPSTFCANANGPLGSYLDVAPNPKI
jgi:hypothetical protein